MTTSRRTFIRIVPIAGAALLAARASRAADVDAKDPQAVALGYVVDATKADKTKYPNYAAGQDCATCQLYQGMPATPRAAARCSPARRSRRRAGAARSRRRHRLFNDDHDDPAG